MKIHVNKPLNYESIFFGLGSTNDIFRSVEKKIKDKKNGLIKLASEVIHSRMDEQTN